MRSSPDDRTAESDHSEAVIERMYDDVVVPSPATPGSAGLDLRAHLRERRVRISDGSIHSERDTTMADGAWGLHLAPREMALVPLGFRTRLPTGVEAQVRPRSGQSFKRALTIPNAPGTVDCDYAEEWMVILRNDGPGACRIVHGERIAQVVFARVAALALREGAVSRSTSRAGGFGSTGER
jgi:dUTP pyrophosphatase